MNRRGFLGRCLAGALLGLARNLPVPAAPKPEREPMTFCGVPIKLDEPMTATEVMRRQEEQLPVTQDLLRDTQRALDGSSIWNVAWGEDAVIIIYPRAK